MHTQELIWKKLEDSFPKKLNERRSVRCFIQTNESGIGYQVGFRHFGTREDWSVIADTLFDHQVIGYAEID